MLIQLFHWVNNNIISIFWKSRTMFTMFEIKVGELVMWTLFLHCVFADCNFIFGVFSFFFYNCESLPSTYDFSISLLVSSAVFLTVTSFTRSHKTKDICTCYNNSLLWKYLLVVIVVAKIPLLEYIYYLHIKYSSQLIQIFLSVSQNLPN